MARRLVFWGGIVLLAIELAGVCALLVSILITVRAVRTLRQDVATVRDTLSALSTASNDNSLVQLRAKFDDVDTNATSVAQEAQMVEPWLVLAKRDARVRQEFSQAGALLSAAAEGSQVAVSAIDMAAQFTAPNGAPSATGQLLHGLQAIQPQLPALLLATTDLSRSLDQITAGVLYGQLAPDLTTASSGLRLARDGIELALQAPDLIGATTPASYLVVAQNPDDLRPTGGYMGSWGVLTVANGHIANLDYRSYDQWESFNDASRVFPAQTQPVQRYFFFCCMAMQDANWYPDYPTTALVLEQFSQADQPRPLSGVIAFDPAVIQALLQATGPVTLTDPAVTVTADNVVDLANRYEGRGENVSAADLLVGKRFLVEVAQVLIGRFSGSQQFSLVSLARGLFPALQHKDLIVALNAGVASSAVHDLGWDGAQLTPSGDYVMLDDMSFSDNKVDSSVTRSFTDNVQLRQDGSADVDLTIQWRNAYPSPTQAGAGTGAVITPTTAMRNFFRLYLPPDATIAAINGVDELWPAGSEAGHQVVQGFLIVPQAGSHTITVRYHVPSVMVAKRSGATYTLLVQTQPGIPPSSFRLHVSSPDGEVLIQDSQTLTGDHNWSVLVAGAGTPPAPPPLPWDRSCQALSLVAGLRGPFSTGPVTVPPSCQPQ